MHKNAARGVMLMVSVFCLTYNHRKYIRKALEGILNQKTTFNYNILVFDDASDDGTSDILLDYQSRYPDRIKIYVSPHNTYGKPERKDLLRKLYDKYLTGKYVAWCEGDDEWIDSNKLQIQIDFLETHPDCSMVSHAFLIKNYQKKCTSKKMHSDDNRFFSPDEIICGNNGNLATASLVMRKDVFLLDGFPDCDVVDYPMQLNALCYGKIYYFTDVMSIYRYMHEGSWCLSYSESINKRVNHNSVMVEFLKKFDLYSDHRFTSHINKRIYRYLYDTVEILTSYDNDPEVRTKANLSNDYGLPTDLIRICEWFSGNYRLSEEELKMISSYRNICVMGNGKYSRIVIENLKKNGIEINDILVSVKSDRDDCLFTLSEYSGNRDQTLVIVGISQLHEDDIRGSLQNEGYLNVLTPLWFDRRC